MNTNQSPLIDISRVRLACQNGIWTNWQITVKGVDLTVRVLSSPNRTDDVKVTDLPWTVHHPRPIYDQGTSTKRVQVRSEKDDGWFLNKKRSTEWINHEKWITTSCTWKYVWLSPLTIINNSWMIHKPCFHVLIHFNHKIGYYSMNQRYLSNIKLRPLRIYFERGLFLSQFL